MILMSRYKGQLHGGKGPNIWSRPSPPLPKGKKFWKEVFPIKELTKNLGGCQPDTVKGDQKEQESFQQCLQSLGPSEGLKGM